MSERLDISAISMKRESQRPIRLSSSRGIANLPTLNLGSNSNFGRNILSSKDGKEIIVSATELDNEGAVFVYNYDIKTDSLTQTQLIVPPPGRQTGRFGSYLAMQGKYLLIADYEDNSNAGAGM